VLFLQKQFMSLIVKNKKASYEYEFIQKLNAGIKLTGGEVKSIRSGKVSISEAYCYIKDGEVFIKGMHIAEYKNSSNYDNHDPIRLRKLLLNKREIIKLAENVEKKGLTIVPISVMINSGGLVKIEIALCRGKNTHDKRNAIKEREYKLEISRELINK
jgi:SsrA-binding protein